MWGEFLTHFKRKFCLDEDMFELENQLLTSKKGSITIEEYTNAFTDKMEFALRVVPDEPTKLDKYSKGFPWEYSIPVK